MRILMLNLTESANDPRVRRVAASLAARGHEIRALNPRGEGRPGLERVAGLEILRFDPRPPAGRGLAARVSGLSQGPFETSAPRAFALLKDLSPRVMDPLKWALARAQRRAQRAWGRLRRSLEQRTSLDLPQVPFETGEITDLFGIRWMLEMNERLVEEGLPFQPQIIHANDLNTLLAGQILRERTRARLVYDAHEIYPEQFPPGERSPLWHSFYTELERALLGHTDARMTVCDSLAQYFPSKYGCGAFHTVRNLPSRGLLAPETVLSRKNRPRELLYHGAFFKHRGLEALVRAARHLRTGRVVLRGLGPETQALRALAAEQGTEDRVRIDPPVPVDELIPAAASSDVGLCPFPSACLNTEYALPNKFFEYLMAGLAVASSDLIELRTHTQALGVGVLFHDLEPEALAQALNDVLADEDRLDTWRRRAWTAARDELHWEHEEERLLAVYRPLS